MLFTLTSCYRQHYVVLFLLQWLQINYNRTGMFLNVSADGHFTWFEYLEEKKKTFEMSPNFLIDSLSVGVDRMWSL